MTEQKPLEPWQWPEEHWRRLVNQVRAGRPLRPKAWKNQRWELIFFWFFSFKQKIIWTGQADRPFMCT